jgi:hypothetical protein
MPDATELGPLPAYDNPPVIETVLGIQFDRFAELKNAHLGAFWKTLDLDEWAEVADAPLLESQFERFSETEQWGGGVRYKLTQDPAARLQIKNATGDRMIQIQNSRLHFNWIKQNGRPYPSYEVVRPEFEKLLTAFEHFLRREKLGVIRPNQWEVSYINDIPQGTVWQTPSEWGFFLPLSGLPRIEHVIEGESFGGEWHFTIPGQRGRLHVLWEHAASAAGESLVRLTLTARGPIPVETSSILRGLDLGRATIVRSFHALMSDAANKYWKVKHAGC